MVESVRLFVRYALEDGVSEAALVRVVQAEGRAMASALVVDHDRSAYTHSGCRCGKCREANRVWVAARRRLKEAA